MCSARTFAASVGEIVGVGSGAAAAEADTANANGDGEVLGMGSAVCATCGTGDRRSVSATVASGVR